MQTEYSFRHSVFHLDDNISSKSKNSNFEFFFICSKPEFLIYSWVEHWSSHCFSVLQRLWAKLEALVRDPLSPDMLPLFSSQDKSKQHLLLLLHSYLVYGTEGVVRVYEGDRDIRNQTKHRWG
jgi:hypothetical protein